MSGSKKGEGGPGEGGVPARAEGCGQAEGRELGRDEAGGEEKDDGDNHSLGRTV